MVVHWFQTRDCDGWHPKQKNFKKITVLSKWSFVTVYSKVAVYKCKLAVYSKAAVYKCKCFIRVFSLRKRKIRWGLGLAPSKVFHTKDQLGNSLLRFSPRIGEGCLKKNKFISCPRIEPPRHSLELGRLPKEKIDLSPVQELNPHDLCLYFVTNNSITR